MKQFRIRGEFIELFKLVKAAGLAETGGQAKLMISEGGVLVNGTAETKKGRKLVPGDKVECSGETWFIESAES